jgi:hypothetical protein
MGKNFGIIRSYHRKEDRSSEDENCASPEARNKVDRYLEIEVYPLPLNSSTINPPHGVFLQRIYPHNSDSSPRKILAVEYALFPHFTQNVSFIVVVTVSLLLIIFLNAMILLVGNY